MKKYRIANKFRFIVFMTLTLLTGMIAFGSFTGFYTAESASESEYKEIYVDSGDTLWQLAQENSLSQTDTRKLVYEICKINHLENEIIYPGQIIKFPVYD